MKTIIVKDDDRNSRAIQFLYPVNPAAIDSCGTIQLIDDENIAPSIMDTILTPLCLFAIYNDSF